MSHIRSEMATTKKSLYIQKWYYDTSNDQPGIYAVNVDGFMTADNAK